MRDAFQEHGALARGAFAVVVLVSLAVLFTPADGVPFAPPGVDKVVHGALFAALALTGRWAGIGRSPLAVLLVGYAAVSEVLQGLTPLDRSASVADWLADVVGILLGLLLWQALTRGRDLAR
jgi:membrane associated rhomboid family serine protease